MYRIASFFAGVGGIDLGFQQTGKCRTVYANEFDPYAADTFALNFPDVLLDRRDIRNVPSNAVPEADILVGGFPCQAFSVAGLRQGFDDEKGRGELFFQLVRILETKYPRAALFENVKNLVGHDHGNTFRVICGELDRLGYAYSYRVLNAMDYGNIPQNRERIYLVAFRDARDKDRFRWPETIPRTRTVQDVIDFDGQTDEKYYYTEGKYKGGIYEKLVHAMQDDDSSHPAVYQWRRRYVRKNKSGVVPTLTANQGGGGHNVCLVKTSHGIRKMTPRECFNSQGFPEDFALPHESDSRLYKQAGNSVCVPVIHRIAEAMVSALEKGEFV